jgi:MGT family glycosyltransferase
MLALSRPFRDYIGRFREGAGRGPFSFDTLWSDLAQITQQPEELEFPRTRLPACFHFTGPFARGSDRPPTPFPWDRLTTAPLVYASFGTTQNRNVQLYDVVARAAEGLDAQVVLSLGGAEWRHSPQELPPNLLVVPFAPQIEVLERAAAMITHAGMNSTLEALAAGVPLVAVPIAHDQHGIAARIEWTGTGVRIPAAECHPDRLRKALQTVLGQPSFREAAARLQRIIADANGLNQAAAIIEQVAESRRPVLRLAELRAPSTATPGLQRKSP